MASGNAVRVRNQKDDISAFELARKMHFKEGIDESTLYVDPHKPGVEDYLDDIDAGIRSAATYIGAQNITEMHKKAVIGVQSSAGYIEGQPQNTSW
jgi:IMP dehydrogenase